MIGDVDIIAANKDAEGGQEPAGAGANMMSHRGSDGPARTGGGNSANTATTNAPGGGNTYAEPGNWRCIGEGSVLLTPDSKWTVPVLDASGRLLGPTTPARTRQLVASGGVVPLEAEGVFGLMLADKVLEGRNLGSVVDAELAVALSWFASQRLAKSVICSSQWATVPRWKPKPGRLCEGNLGTADRSTIKLNRAVLRSYVAGECRGRGLLGIVEHETCHIAHPLGSTDSVMPLPGEDRDRILQVAFLAYKLEEVRCEARRIADGLEGTRALLREARWLQYGKVEEEVIFRPGGLRTHGAAAAIDLLGAVRNGLFDEGEVDMGGLAQTLQPGALDTILAVLDEICELGDTPTGENRTREVAAARVILDVEPYAPIPPFVPDGPARREDFKTRAEYKARKAPPYRVEWRPLGGVEMGPDDDLGLGDALARVRAFCAAAREMRGV